MSRVNEFFGVMVAGMLVGPGICVQVVVAKIEERASMELVGTALGLIENIAAKHVAILCRSIRGDHLHLTDRIHAGAIAGNIVEILVDIHAVEQVIVGLLAVAVDGDGLVGADRPGDWQPGSQSRWGWC